MNARLHRTNRPSETNTRRFKRQIGPEVKDDDEPLVRRQAIDRASQVVPLGQCPERVRRGDVLMLRPEGDEPDATSPPEPIPTDVDEDPVKPGGKIGRASKRVRGLPSARQGIAYRILRLIAITEYQSGESIKPIELAVREAGEKKTRIGELSHGRSFQRLEPSASPAYRDHHTH